MSEKILVTYASRTGTTESVAQVIGKNLIESGAVVDVLPMQSVLDLSPYAAVIAGSAIRKSKWLPEAQQFILAHRTELAGKPFAMFTVCITLAMSQSEQYLSAVKGWVSPVRELVRPVSEGFFPGLLDFGKLPFSWDTMMLWLSVAIGIFPRGDRRDWKAVQAWTTELKSILLAL